MRRDISHIEIKDPPMKELEKKRSCLKRSCTTGCGCIILVMLVFLLLLKFAAAPRPKELKTLPESFPGAVPVYDTDNIEYITFLSGRQKNRILEAAAYIPKIVLVPIFIVAEDYAPEETRSLLKEMENESGWHKFIALMTKPVTTQRDTFEIKWLDLTAQPDFVKDYYETGLRKQEFNLEIASDDDKTRQIVFSHDEIQGVLYIKDDPQTDGTDTVILTVTIPEN